jgi:hypothetical protein
MPRAEPLGTNEFDFALGGLVLEGDGGIGRVRVGVPGRAETSVERLG